MFSLTEARVPYKMSEKNYSEYADWVKKLYPELKGHGAKVLTAVITEKCELNCSYCYQTCKNGKTMQIETIKRIVDKVFEEDEKEDSYLDRDDSFAIVLDFIGGEPFLAVDEMGYFIDYFREVAIAKRHRWAVWHRINITTNGVSYLSEKARAFVKKYEDKLSLGITIDGNKELHDACRVFHDGRGSYDTVEASVKQYVQDFLNPATKLTLAPQNVPYLFEAFKNLESLGIYIVNANVVFEKGWETEHAVTLYEQMKQLADYMLTESRYVTRYCSLFEERTGKRLDDDDDKNWCGGTGLMLSFDTEGIAYPCLRYMPFSLRSDRKPLVIGNIVEGIGVMPAHREVIEELAVITRTSQSSDECMACPINEGCAWCSAYNYDEFETANKRATYICEMHKARVLANVYYWNKVYRLTGNLDLAYPNNTPKEWALNIISEEEFEMLDELTKR